MSIDVSHRTRLHARPRRPPRPRRARLLRRPADRIAYARPSRTGHRRAARQRAAHADRDRGFRRRRATWGAGSPAIVTNNLKRSGYFAPIDKARFPEQQPAFNAAPQFEAWKAVRRAGPCDRPRHARLRGAPENRVSALGCDHGPTDYRPAVFHRPEQLAARRAHHLGRRLHQDHRRRRLLRHARRVRRRDRGRRRTAASASPSWTRTAPTCAT